MCLIVPGYNNNANFRIESNLNSIFTQNYSNYKVIIINDASTDGSGDIYRRYLEFYGIDPARYTYIENKVRVTAVENIYIASTQHCAKDEIVVTIDADDELLGRNALKVFNWAFQTKKLGVVYSNFYFYRQSV
jgi:glycosyltransferase involved in cell wall biosynthesis